MSTGSNWGADHSKFEHLKCGKEGDKVMKMACGPCQRFILTEENKVYYVGTSADFDLPESASQSSFKEFKLS